jgi:hypothetical protein
VVGDDVSGGGGFGRGRLGIGGGAEPGAENNQNERCEKCCEEHSKTKKLIVFIKIHRLVLLIQDDRVGGEGCFDINDLLVAGTTVEKSIILLRFDEGTCNNDVQEVHNFKRFDGRPFITCPKPDGFGGKFGFYSFA